MELDKFELSIGINFNDKELLQSALTHKSFVGASQDNLSVYNQRLEFLGDSVLNLIISQHLYSLNEGENEGILTSKRSNIVNEETLSQVAQDIRLYDYLRMSPAELSRKGNKRNAALGDALEALFGAYFIDQGYKKTKSLILKLMERPIDISMQQKNHKDSKSSLQEILQAKGFSPPKYKLKKVNGPSHDPIFETEVYINQVKISHGEGKKKIASEQKAASLAIGHINKFGINSILEKKSLLKTFLAKFNRR